MLIYFLKSILHLSLAHDLNTCFSRRLDKANNKCLKIHPGISQGGSVFNTWGQLNDSLVEEKIIISKNLKIII